MSQTPSDTFKLSYPFTTAAGTRIELVELKRLTVKDLKQVRKISKNPADWDEPLIARSTGLLPEDLDNMDLADYLQLQKRFQLITGMGESNQGADAGAGAAGEMVPVSAGEIDALDTDDLEMWLEQAEEQIKKRVRRQIIVQTAASSGCSALSPHVFSPSPEVNHYVGTVFSRRCYRRDDWQHIPFCNERYPPCA